jgi:hypothetical protein
MIPRAPGRICYNFHDVADGGARAKALREMMGPARLERQKGGMLEATWHGWGWGWRWLCSAALEAGELQASTIYGECLRLCCWGNSNI